MDPASPVVARAVMEGLTTGRDGDSFKARYRPADPIRLDVATVYLDDNRFWDTEPQRLIMPIPEGPLTRAWEEDGNANGLLKTIPEALDACGVKFTLVTFVAAAELRARVTTGSPAPQRGSHYQLFVPPTVIVALLPGTSTEFAVKQSLLAIGGELANIGSPSNTGTLTGYVKMRKGDEACLVALTCHHIAVPDTGEPVLPSDSPQIAIECPSPEDYTNVVRSLLIKATSTHTSMAAALRPAIPIPAPYMRGFQVNTVADMLACCHAAPRHFGTVIASSGLSAKSPHGARLDLFLAFSDDEEESSDDDNTRMGRRTSPQPVKKKAAPVSTVTPRKDNKLILKLTPKQGQMSPSKGTATPLAGLSSLSLATPKGSAARGKWPTPTSSAKKRYASREESTPSKRRKEEGVILSYLEIHKGFLSYMLLLLLTWAAVKVDESRIGATDGAINNVFPALSAAIIYSSSACKFGRTTGATAGVQAGVRSIIRRYLPGGPHIESIEQAVMDDPGCATAPFARAGDSGAMVCDPERCCFLGPLWGGLEDGKGNMLQLVYFYTPLNDVMEDLRRVFAASGVEVEWA
ncbi:uncharacterized protein E0L32_007867 [Thyridium curvatum]|uniref:Uncharacterized protein n=1 Tax=Thyridium curvatum TaxID=1093900 RepID=A0A507B3G7_9PEZI|nr:uncharacterized protein E0L32_007867 [Thyridium curvatum]TPX11448.1 hypothetical protein E0L32_007867 [Thyridium curvatum]